MGTVAAIILHASFEMRVKNEARKRIPYLRGESGREVLVCCEA